MQGEMSSRERTLAAINHQQPDRVPIFFRGVAPLEHLWRNKHERIDVLLGLGVDEKATIGIGPSIHPDVTVRDWFDEESDSKYRLACREYRTPEGTLRTIVRCTNDCAYEGGVLLTSNYNISRGVEFLVNGREDLPKLAYLIGEPDREDIARFRDEAKREKKFAGERGILVEGGAGPSGDFAFLLCGTNLLYLAQDDPDFVEELMEMTYNAGLKCLEIVLDEGVDTVNAGGCYETAPLWSPQLYDRLFAPRLEKKVRLAHQAGVKLSYFSTGDFVPHLDTLLRTGVDIVNAIRPFHGGINDMRLLKQRIGHRICLWGGMNPEEHIETGSPEHVRRSVAEVILAAASGGGFVLSTGGAIYDEGCYDNVMAFIEAAHEFGSYPIDAAQLEAVK